MHVALTIAGSDTSAGAGIQADLRVFSELRVYGTSVVTALTAQNTRGISKITPVNSATVKEQIKAILNDFEIDAIKIGMVYSYKIIESVYRMLNRVDIPVVLDPVLSAGTGAVLLREDSLKPFIRKLMPLAEIVTPNQMEAERISDVKIRNIDEARQAAERISELGPRNVIIKGGHMGGKYATDVLYHEGEFYEFSNERIDIRGVHGAGCAFSAAVTAELAKGVNIISAAQRANEFVNRAIKNALKIGKGLGIPNFTMLAQKNKLLETLDKAVAELESNPDFSNLIPESSSNFVYAKPNAHVLSDVAGVSGRIVKIGDKAKAADAVSFGASRHVASAILALMEHDKSIRSAINIKFDERIIEICKDLGLNISYYDRGSEPADIKSKEGMSVKWGIEQALSKIDAIPDVIYHQGDWGKEPMILVCGTKPSQVVSKINLILKNYRN